MTPEETNRLIAEKVMGYTDIHFNDHYKINGVKRMYAITDYSGSIRASVGSFSTDIAAALQVVEKMREEGYWVEMFSDPTGKMLWVFEFSIGTGPTTIYSKTQNESLPMAICLAALKAVS